MSSPITGPTDVYHPTAYPQDLGQPLGHDFKGQTLLDATLKTGKIHVSILWWNRKIDENCLPNLPGLLAIRFQILQLLCDTHGFLLHDPLCSRPPPVEKFHLDILIQEACKTWSCAKLGPCLVIKPFWSTTKISRICSLSFPDYHVHSLEKHQH